MYPDVAVSRMYDADRRLDKVPPMSASGVLQTVTRQIPEVPWQTRSDVARRILGDNGVYFRVTVEIV